MSKNNGSQANDVCTMSPEEKAEVQSLSNRVAQKRADLGLLVEQFEAQKSARLAEISSIHQQASKRVVEIMLFHGIRTDGSDGIWSVDIERGIFTKTSGPSGPLPVEIKTS